MTYVGVNKISSILSIRNKICLQTVKAPIAELYVFTDCLEFEFFSLIIPTSWRFENVPFILRISCTKRQVAYFELELNLNTLLLQNFIGGLPEQGAQDCAIHFITKH